MVQSSFRRGEFLESSKKVTLESAERTRHMLHEANDCREIIRRSRQLLSDSRQSISQDEKHGTYQHLTRAQALELYDKATRTFLSTRDSGARREVIELHHLLQRLK